MSSVGFEVKKPSVQSKNEQTLDKNNREGIQTYDEKMLDISKLGKDEIIRLLRKAYPDLQQVEKVVKTIQNAPSRGVIGRWIDVDPYRQSIGFIFVKTFYDKNGVSMMEDRSINDQSHTSRELIEKKFKRQRRFDEKIPLNSLGEYFLINKKGDLEIYDREGYIETWVSIE